MEAGFRTSDNRRARRPPHPGRPASSGLAILALVIGVTTGAGRAWAQAEKLPKAEEILDKSIEALGGKAAMEKIRSRVSKGTFEFAPQGFKGPVTTYELAPNKSYAIVEMEGLGKIESGTDGMVHWELATMGGPRVLEGEEKALNERLTTFNAALYWRKLYKSAECVGVEDVDDRPCYKVVLTPEVGKPETNYFDRKTYLPVKIALVVKTPFGDAPIEVMPEDYRKVDGVLIPYKTTQKLPGNQQIITLKSVEHNVDIPASRFALPEPVKELVEKSKAETKPAAGEKQKKEEPQREKS